jgi:hypothetical protein
MTIGADGAATRAFLPAKRGLYDPSHERDACGVGFIADLNGENSSRWLISRFLPTPCFCHTHSLPASAAIFASFLVCGMLRMDVRDKLVHWNTARAFEIAFLASLGSLDVRFMLVSCCLQVRPRTRPWTKRWRL